jgi:tripartite-type tricarboxylate transporter receptor subunit TctC
MGRIIARGIGVLAAMLLFGVAAAQSYPNKPIRFIVPYPPGGGTDIVARLIAPKMAQSLGQPIVVDNRPGASTIIGTEMLAKAPPDGYTIGLITDSHSMNPSFFKTLPYDSQKDFQPITRLVFVPLMLIAHPSLQVKSVQELLASPKAREGRINYASIGNGTPHYLAMEWLKSLAKLNATHVPYKGVAPAVTDVVGGQVDMMFTGMSSALPHVKSGKVVALGVSSAQRQPAAPEIPAVAETPGLSNFDFMTWYGVAAPAGTPPEIVARLNAEITKALGEPDVKEKLAGLGVVGAPTSPSEFAAFMTAEARKVGEIIKVTGAKGE